MKRSAGKRNLFAIAIVSLLLALAMPTTSFGQRYGRHGRGRDNRGWKCGKFVNCHDARDGRWDGRGPRGDRVGNIILRNRIRNRNLRFADNGIVLRPVRRARIRNFDDDRVFRNRRFRNSNDGWFVRNRNWRHGRR